MFQTNYQSNYQEFETRFIYGIETSVNKSNNYINASRILNYFNENENNFITSELFKQAQVQLKLSPFFNQFYNTNNIELTNLIIINDDRQYMKQFSGLYIHSLLLQTLFRYISLEFEFCISGCLDQNIQFLNYLKYLSDSRKNLSISQNIQQNITNNQQSLNQTNQQSIPQTNQTNQQSIPFEMQSEKYKQHYSGYLIISFQNNQWKTTTSNFKHLNERIKLIDARFNSNKLQEQFPLQSLNRISINDFKQHNSPIKLLVRIPINDQQNHKSLWNNIKKISTTFTSDTTKRIIINQGINDNDFLNEIIRMSHQSNGTILWPLYINARQQINENQIIIQPTFRMENQSNKQPMIVINNIFKN